MLSEPVVVVVPLEVPVRVAGACVPNVKSLPFVADVTVKVSVPVTVFVELVVKLALPVTVSAFVPVAKHDPALKKPKPVTLSGPLLVTVKVVTKFSRLACSVPPVSCASQFPVAWVFVVFDGAPLVPHPQTASSSANRANRASFFMNRPSNGVSSRLERCGPGRQWMSAQALSYPTLAS